MQEFARTRQLSDQDLLEPHPSPLIEDDERKLTQLTHRYLAGLGLDLPTKDVGFSGEVNQDGPLPQPSPSVQRQPTPEPQQTKAPIPERTTEKRRITANHYFREPSPEFYDDVLIHEQHRKNTRSRAARDQRGNQLDVPSSSPSLFSKVTYMVAGTFPKPPSRQAPASPIRVSLVNPTVASPEQDILVAGHIFSKHPVSLCWYLSYGPRRIMLNLDQLYEEKAVTTFQVSDTGILLTVRAGTLVTGWDYYLHLTVSSGVVGVSAHAQTCFTIPPSQAFAQRAAEWSTARNKELNASTMHSYAPGYIADEERGHQPAAVRIPPQTPLAANTPQLGLSENRSDAGAVPEPSASSAPTQRGMTFQEQLWRFVETQLRPLFDLCTSPTMTRDEFDAVVLAAAKEYESPPTPSATLTPPIQKEILGKIKGALIQRWQAREAENSTTAIADVACRPGYALRQR
jgi:hypothetical protein